MKNLLRYASMLAIVLCFSCDNVDPFDIDEVDFGDPEIGVPLVNSTFYIADLGVDPDNNTEVITDSLGRVTLRYTDQINPIPVTEVFPAVANKELTISTSPHDFSLPFHDIDIRLGVLKDTRAYFEITNPTNQPLTVMVAIPALIDPNSGLTFSNQYVLQPNEVFRSATEDFSELEVISPQGKLQLEYTAQTSTDPSVDIADFSMHFAALNFSYVEGVFENVVLPTTEDLIDISFFDSWVSGGLNLSDPKLKFNIENSVGIPAQVKLNYAKITTIDNVTFDLESDLFNEGISFDYPSLEEIGESKPTTVEINSDNSNVVDLFDKKPSGIDYDLDLTINADQNNEVGFYTDDSQIAIDAIVELPLYLRANDLILQDTFGFEEIDFDEIGGTAELKLSLINAFPIGVGVNLYFLNDAGETLFTLIESNEWISVAANTDVSLTVDELEAQLLSIPIAEDDLLKLPSVSKVLARVLITTTESFADDYVWVYEHHGIDIKLGAVLK